MAGNIMMEHVLCYDLSNVAYLATAFLEQGFETRSGAVQRLYQSIRTLCRQLYFEVKADMTLFACDSSPYWRHGVFPDYKANRVDSALRDCVRAAIEVFKSQHERFCIEVDGCEADDVMCALAQQNEARLTFISMDGDLHQLVDQQVSIYHPRQRAFLKPLSTVQRDFELFLKCIRGDRGDNIPSAYPYVTKKRLKRAFTEPQSMQKLMTTRIADGSIVEDNYRLNRQLIDLSQIPLELHNEVQSVIEETLVLCQA